MSRCAVPPVKATMSMRGLSTSAWVNFKLNEVANNYTEVGFGAITWHGLTINKARMARLPKDVQAIIMEVAKEYEAKTGTVNQENYPKQIAQLKTLGVNVKSVPNSVRVDWATLRCAASTPSSSDSNALRT